MTEKLTDFILEYTDYKIDRDALKEIIRQHIEYSTCDYCLDKLGNIMFVVRWNIWGKSARILDLVIHPLYHRQLNFRWIIARNIVKFPYVEYLTWNRYKKYPLRQPKKYCLEKLLKIKFHKEEVA